MVAPYVPLWCRSNFSFLEGASHPDEWVEAAHEAGLQALALTDRNGVYGVVQAHEKAREHKIHLIIGSELTLHDGSTLVLLCQDRGGYAQLCRLISKGRLRNPKGVCTVSWDEVCEHANGLLALWGGRRSLITAEVEPWKLAHALKETFGDRLYAMMARHREAEEVTPEERLRERVHRYGLPVVAAVEMLYHAPERREIQDVLTCIRHGCTLFQAGTRTHSNGEHALLTPAAFSKLFADQPEAVARTVEVAERCTFNMAELRYRYPAERLPDGTTSAQWLRHLTLEGARRRYQGDIPEDVLRQIDRELLLIEELDYNGYFLTMWEIVVYCREHGILCQGRGSAANSAVCFCLGITAVDPVRMGLLFERFISRERAEPPDIDLDISHERREEVIQHVYAKYGRTHAAMVANVVRYRARSAVRDVGKVLGLPETALDRLSKMLPHYEKPSPDAFAHAGLDAQVPAQARLIEIANTLLDFPRHLSVHPGGFLLGHDPVHDLVPIENATMENRTVIQWDKNDVEALGLFKVDLLGLGALTQVDLAFNLMDKHYGVKMCMATVPPADKETFDMASRADTVGVFQIESRAQMSMLPRLKPQCFYDLVVEVGIVRPGPISGGMVHPYLRRRHGLEPIEYPHECLKPVLEKTMGVPLFQEQVMRLAMVAADYTPGEADQLRRDMAVWKRSGKLDKHRAKLINRMVAKGIAPEFAERVFKQIMGFAEYGFPESHAASFALISYVTAWLKCHYPSVFTCSLLNAQPMGFYTPATILEDAKHHDVPVLPIDVMISQEDCTLELVPESPALAVRMGLRYIKGWGDLEQDKLATARRQSPFASLQDFILRTRLDEGSLCALAEAGALESLCPSRRDALWAIRGILRNPQLSLPLVLPEDQPAFTPLTPLDTVVWDYRTSNHSPRGHPLQSFRAQLTAQGIPTAQVISTMKHGQRVKYAALVICRQRPLTASGVTFMTLEDETGFVNAVVWPKIFEAHTALIRTALFLGITGKLQVQDGVTHLIAETVWMPQVQGMPVTAGSRDFH